MEDNFKIGGIFNVVCYDKDGVEKWRDEAKNIVPDAGLNHILDVVVHGTTAVSPWYIGLKGVGTAVAADTLASHASWTENTAYTGDRKEMVEAAASGKSISNSASKATFAITSDAQTIAGSFLASTATGTSGVLLSVADFTGGNKSCDSGDSLEVTYTLSAATS